MRPRILQMTATVALAVALAVSTVPAFAQQSADFAKGVAAFDAGDFKAAREFWEPLAEDGDVEATRNLAQLYRLGLGVEKDDAAAFALYKVAAEQGNADAQVNTAYMLLFGKGTELDREEAATWFAKASDQGNARAHYNLALMHEKGIGVTKDEDYAIELYRLAADKGQARAISRLEALETAAQASETTEAEIAAAKAKVEEEAAAIEKAEAAKVAEEAERAAAKAAAETKAAEANTPALSIKPLEFEKLDGETAALPAYKSEAAQNGVKTDDRPIINVVRTPTRKPGTTDPKAAAGDEPTPVYVQTVTIENEDTAEAATPTPAYVQKYEADSGAEAGAETGAPTPAYVPKYEAESDASESGAPEPAYVQKYDAGADKAASASGGDTKAAASLSTSEMRMPSDPAAQVKMAESAYRNGDFAMAVRVLAPLSDAGMPVAQFWMGRLYNRGEGVDLNRAEAYSLWRSASAGGSARAATALANLASRLSPEEISYAEQMHAASGRVR